MAGMHYSYNMSTCAFLLHSSYHDVRYTTID